MELNDKIELLKLAAAMAAQDKNTLSLTRRLGLAGGEHDGLSMTLAIYRELVSELSTTDTAAAP